LGLGNGEGKRAINWERGRPAGEEQILSEVRKSLWRHLGNFGAGVGGNEMDINGEVDENVELDAKARKSQRLMASLAAEQPCKIWVSHERKEESG